jgi:hypothetical protein
VPALYATTAPVTTTTTSAAVPSSARAHGGKHRSRMHQKLARTMLRTVDRWRLIEPGDRLLVAISGGKDSYALLDLLWQAKQRAPFPFEVVALHVDQAQPGYDGRPLVADLFPPPEGYDGFSRRLLDHLDSPETLTYSVLFTVVGRVRGGAHAA